MGSDDGTKKRLDDNIILKAVGLGRKTGHVLVATADRSGLPHVASAGSLQSISDRYVEVEAWFCPGTVLNLQQNRLISLVVWEPATDQGYQILGEVENIADKMMMDGYAPETEERAPLPQTDRTLRVRVDRVVSFSQAPHSDVAQ